jgi:hypothetical protein
MDTIDHISFRSKPKIQIHRSIIGPQNESSDASCLQFVIYFNDVLVIKVGHASLEQQQLQSKACAATSNHHFKQPGKDFAMERGRGAESSKARTWPIARAGAAP